MFFKYYYSAQFLYKAWKRFRKYGAALTAATQNVEECLRSETARLMFANSEFLVLLNQAATDRAELAKLLNISENQMGYVTNAEAGHGLLRVGGAIVPFANEFPGPWAPEAPCLPARARRVPSYLGLRSWVLPRP